MTYVEKYAKIRPFVNLNIPHNKKDFSPQEKSMITRYYEKLNALGYLHPEREGYVLKDISGTKYRTRNAPKLKKVWVFVGTKIDRETGRIGTQKAKVVIRGKKLFVKKENGARFRYEKFDAKKDWDALGKEALKKHLRKIIGKNAKGFMLRNGISSLESTLRDNIDAIAEDILLKQARYENHEDWLGELEIFEDLASIQEAVIESNKGKTKRKKRKSKRERIKGRR